MKAVNRIARGAWMLGAFGLVVGMYACAAPDAEPGRRPPMPDGGDAGSASGGAGGGSGGTGGSGGSEPLTEPLAGIPQWAKGFGSAGNFDQRAFDVALGPTPDSVVATMWFYQSSVVLDPVGTYTASNTSDIVVAKFGVSDGAVAWAKHIKSDGGVIRSVVEADPQGNTIVAGGFYGIMTIDGADSPPKGINYDAYFAKFNSLGEPVWVQTFGENLNQIITDVAVDKDGNIIVVGVTEGSTYKFGTTNANGDLTPSPVDSMAPNKDDLFVAKFDTNGKILWASRFGTAGNRNDGADLGDWHDPIITVAASRTDGSIVVAGAFSQSVTFGATKVTAKGTDDGFVTKLNADGTTQWHVTFGNIGYAQRVRGVAYTSTGDAILTGSFQGKIDIGGVELTSYQDSEDVLVAKVSGKDGKVVWANGYGLLGKQQGSTVLVDAKDQAVLFGTFVGAIDFTKNGGAVVDTTLGTATDLFMAKFSASGKPFWGRRYGDIDAMGLDNQDLGGATLAKDADTDVAIVCGMNRSSIDLAPLPLLKTAGLEDAFLMSVTY